MTCRERELHLHNEVIRSSFTRLLATGAHAAAVPGLLALAMAEFDGPQQAYYRAAVVERVLCPCLTGAPHNHVQTFFQAQIGRLCQVLDGPLLPNSDPAAADQQDIKRSSCLLLQILYASLPAASVIGPGIFQHIHMESLTCTGAIINVAYVASVSSPTAPPTADDGKQLTRALCTTLPKLLLDAGVPPASSRRLLHCAAFNAFAALLSATQV